MFPECIDILASDQPYKNPKLLESKKIQAFSSARACAEMLKTTMDQLFKCKDMDLMDKLFKCKDMDLMGKLNDALRCTWELMQEYPNKVSLTGIGSLLLQQNKYWPLLLDSSQHDSRSILVDIEIFCRNVWCFYASTIDISNLHKGIPLTYTTSRFLQDVVLENACFQEMPPPPCPLEKPKKKKV